MTTTKGKKVVVNRPGAYLVQTTNRNLLSMGRALKEGYSFYFGPYGEQSYMKLPSGDKVVIKLGDDGIGYREVHGRS